MTHVGKRVAFSRITLIGLVVLLLAAASAIYWFRFSLAELSRVPSSLVHRVAAVPGVESSRRCVYHTIQRELQGAPFRMAILGLDWPTDHGGWLPLIRGRTLQQGHYEMVADRSLGLRLGEQISLGKDTFQVVGITDGMLSASGDGIGIFSLADAQSVQVNTPGEAIRLERAAREARGESFELTVRQPDVLENVWKQTAQLPAVARPQISAVLVSLAPGTQAEQVVDILAGWGDVSVYTAAGRRDLLAGNRCDCSHSRSSSSGCLRHHL